MDPGPRHISMDSGSRLTPVDLGARPIPRSGQLLQTQTQSLPQCQVSNVNQSLRDLCNYKKRFNICGFRVLEEKEEKDGAEKVPEE